MKTKTKTPQRSITQEHSILVIEEIERVVKGDSYALACRAFDIDTQKKVKVLLNFDFKELLYVVATGETYSDTLSEGKEESQ